MTTATQEKGKQISLTFGKDELELLDLLDTERKKQHISRSGWFKNQLREKFNKQDVFSLY